MEEYFLQKCVTSDAAPAPPAPIPTWTTSHRCECVMVQENVHANGASRAVLASIVAITTASNKTQRVAVYTLEPPLASLASLASEKLVVMDFSADWLCLEATLSATPADSPLLSSMNERLGETLNTPATSAAGSSSARPNVVVVDSLNILLEIYPLTRLLTWIRQLRRDPRVGSVIFRLNAAALATPSAVQTLAHEATAVVHVETHSSLLSYSVLSKERRREIPKRKHGMVLLLRKKKNGRTSESVEYFHVSNGHLEYSSNGETVATVPATSSSTKQGTVKNGGVFQAANVTPSAPAAETIRSGKALPVGADEVSFSLSISVEEETAKRNVQLPYMHQGGGAGGGEGVNNLLFIDEDDPDWDDDDLDDDLDI